MAKPRDVVGSGHLRGAVGESDGRLRMRAGKLEKRRMDEGGPAAVRRRLPFESFAALQAAVILLLLEAQRR